METRELFHELSADIVDQTEIEHILLGHFSGAMERSPEVITYQRGNDVALTLTYKDGLLRSIAAGPGLNDEDVSALKQKINDELLTPGPTKVARQILFTVVPVDGWYRYKDIFQISAVPPEAPRPKTIIGDHPFFLEYSYADSSTMRISLFRRGIRERELELLLNALLCFTVESIGNRARFHWTLPEDPTTTNPTSAYGQEAYVWPGLELIGDNFFPSGNAPPLLQIPSKQYYSRRGIMPDQRLDLPDKFDQLIDAFLSLPKTERERFLRASFWFQYSNRVFTYARSAAYTALVSAVEGLMPPLGRGPTCATCGQHTGDGPTKQFAKFVEQFAAGGPIGPKERKQFYALRSAIAHGSKLLRADHNVWGEFTATTLKEGHDMDIMWRIVRAVLVNWLDAITTSGTRQADLATGQQAN